VGLPEQERQRSRCAAEPEIADKRDLEVIDRSQFVRIV
jgi:hypothetical protein